MIDVIFTGFTIYGNVSVGVHRTEFKERSREHGRVRLYTKKGTVKGILQGSRELLLQCPKGVYVLVDFYDQLGNDIKFGSFFKLISTLFLLIYLNENKDLTEMF